MISDLGDYAQGVESPAAPGSSYEGSSMELCILALARILILAGLQGFRYRSGV